MRTPPRIPTFNWTPTRLREARPRNLANLQRGIQTLYAKLTDNDDELVASKLEEGSWYLDWIEVNRSRISTTDGRDPLSGLTCGV